MNRYEWNNAYVKAIYRGTVSTQREANAEGSSSYSYIVSHIKFEVGFSDIDFGIRVLDLERWRDSKVGICERSSSNKSI